MSYIRYGFATVIIIVGVVSALSIGGFPTEGNELYKSFLFASGIYSLGLLMFIWGFGRFRKLQLVRNTPTSKIRSVAMGNVELKGNSEVKQQTFNSPFTNEECIYCKYTVEEYHEDDEGGGTWHTKLSNEKKAEFILNDRTGQITVKPEGAQIHLSPDNVYTVRDHEEVPENIKTFLEENESVAIQEGGWLSTKKDRRYKEWYKTPGEELYIYGYADTENGDSVINKGESPMFLISDKSEKDLRDSWSTSYKLLIVGGIILTAIGFYLMFSITGAL